MLQIYHAPRTRGFRVIWLCEELALPYSIVRVDMAPAYRSSPEWRRLNPVGKVPVMRDGDLAMFESGAMVQYLLDRYARGRLQPAAGTAEHGLYLQWSWFAEATFARPLGEIVNHRREFAGAEAPAAIAEMRARALSCAQAVDQAVQDKSYLLGDEFSAADIMMGYTLRIYQRLRPDPLPEHAARYWNTLIGRP
ncbi:MAG: glutathione S-transferase, partial [Betaproteobacteria bacterium]